MVLDIAPLTGEQ